METEIVRDSAGLDALRRASQSLNVKLTQVAQTLVEYPSTYIDIYGHTDPSGADLEDIQFLLYPFVKLKDALKENPLKFRLFCIPP